MHRANTTFVKIQISFWSETKNTHMPYFLDELRSRPIQNLVWLSPSIMKNSSMIWLVESLQFAGSQMATQHVCWPVYHFMCSSRVAQPVLCFDTEKMGNGEEKEEKFKEYVRKMEYCDRNCGTVNGGRFYKCLQKRHLLWRRAGEKLGWGLRMKDVGYCTGDILERRLQREAEGTVLLRFRRHESSLP